VLTTYFRKAWQPLRLRDPLSDDPTAQILHALLIVLVGWVILDLTVALPMSPRKPAIAAMDVLEVLFTVAHWSFFTVVCFGRPV
jgi:hypothetical protein